MVWVLQFLVLVFTAAVWWLARRDLTARAAEARAPVEEDWTRLRITVEQLMVELERRAIVAEQRIYEAEQRLRVVEQRLHASLAQAEAAGGDLIPPLSVMPAPPAQERASAPAPVSVAAAEPVHPVPLAVEEKVEAALPAAAPALPAAPPPLHLTPENARYLPVFALADAGQADAAEIARQTGLPRGEVDLLLSLRPRRAG